MPSTIRVKAWPQRFEYEPAKTFDDDEVARWHAIGLLARMMAAADPDEE